MSKFSPLGSCQRQFLKKIDSSAPAVIPRRFLNQLGFAMWTPTTRQQHSRTVTRYQTDLTDAEWQVIAPHLPKSCATGRPREWPMREILNGIFYAVRAGCPWRLLLHNRPRRLDRSGAGRGGRANRAGGRKPRRAVPHTSRAP
jgi:hypothetical protein